MEYENSSQPLSVEFVTYAANNLSAREAHTRMQRYLYSRNIPARLYHDSSWGSHFFVRMDAKDYTSLFDTEIRKGFITWSSAHDEAIPRELSDIIERVGLRAAAELPLSEWTEWD